MLIRATTMANVISPHDGGAVADSDYISPARLFTGISQDSLKQMPSGDDGCGHINSRRQARSLDYAFARAAVISQNKSQPYGFTMLVYATLIISAATAM